MVPKVLNSATAAIQAVCYFLGSILKKLERNRYNIVLNILHRLSGGTWSTHITLHVSPCWRYSPLEASLRTTACNGSCYFSCGFVWNSTEKIHMPPRKLQ